MSYIRLLAAHPRFLAFGFALAFFSSFGQTFFISLFGEGIRDSLSLDHSQFGLCYSLATLASGLTIIWLGQKIDSVDLRPFSISLCIGLILACFGMAAAQSVVVLTVVLFLLRLTGQGLLSHTAMTSMARYFHEGRGKAMSIAGFGFPAGEALLPVIAVSVMAHVGWRQTWAFIGIMLLILMAPLVLWLLKGHGERHRALLQRLSDEQNGSGNVSTKIGKQWTRREVLRDVRFYVLLPVVMASGFIVTGIFFHQTHLVEVKQWSTLWFASCFAIFAGAQLPAGLAAGPLVDRFGARTLLPFVLLPLAAAMAALAVGRHPATAAIFMGFAGITSGLTGTVIGSMWAEVYGVRHLGGIRAMVTAISVFGTAGSPVTMGWLIDAGISIETIAWACCGYALLGAALAWIAMRLRSTS